MNESPKTCKPQRNFIEDARPGRDMFFSTSKREESLAKHHLKKKQQHIDPSRFDISQSDTGKFVSSREMAVPSGKCRPVNEMFRCQTGNPWKLRVYLANYFRRSKWKPLVLIQSPRYRSNAGLHHFDIKESVHKLCVWHLIEIPGSWSHRILRNILRISK